MNLSPRLLTSYGGGTIKLCSCKKSLKNWWLKSFSMWPFQTIHLLLKFKLMPLAIKQTHCENDWKRIAKGSWIRPGSDMMYQRILHDFSLWKLAKTGGEDRIFASMDWIILALVHNLTYMSHLWNSSTRFWCQVQTISWENQHSRYLKRADLYQQVFRVVSLYSKYKKVHYASKAD